MDLLEHVADRLEKLDDRLYSIDQTLIKNTQSLEEHMRRTALLEAELRPVKQHVERIQFISKAIGVLVAGGTAVLSLAKALGISW